MKKYIPIFILVTATGCASVHPGNMAETKLHNAAIPLVVSGEVDDDAETTANSLVNLTFENPSARWVRIESVEVVINPSKTSEISVVRGKDLTDWMSAYLEKKKMDDYNSAVFTTSVLAGGAILSGVTASSDSSAGKALNATGNLAVAGTLGYVGVKGIGEARSNVQNPEKTADREGTAAFSVPAGLFARKWILLNHPAGEHLTKIVLAVKTVEGESEYYEIPLL